jgi:SAM-dependent methyltransferase
MCSKEKYFFVFVLFFMLCHFLPFLTSPLAKNRQMVQKGFSFDEPSQTLELLPQNAERQPQLFCEAVSGTQLKQLQAEIKHYEVSQKFKDKIEEARGTQSLAATHVSIISYLKTVLEPDWSVIELGCAAGVMLRLVKELYEERDMPLTHIAGVELVSGWVRESKTYLDNIDIHEGDITSFQLPDPRTFDFIMLNDVVEHVQKDRYECLFHKLDTLSHPGTIVYMHTPTPEAQLKDTGQYYENVLPHHFVISGMASVGFRLIKFEHDLETDCQTPKGSLPLQIIEAKCLMGGWPKYYHAVFQKTEKNVFTIL